MLFAYVVCSLLVAEVYSYYPIRFRDGSQSEPIRHPYHPEGEQQQKQNPVYPPNNPDGKNHPKHEGKHEQKHPHESRDAETQQKFREIYEKLVKAYNSIVNDERKQIELLNTIVDSVYVDIKAERKVEEFLKGTPDPYGRYLLVSHEVAKLLDEIHNAEGSNNAGKVSQLQGDLNQLVYRLYNEVAHSSRRRLEFIKLILDGAAGDKAANDVFGYDYNRYPEDELSLLDAMGAAGKDIYEVRLLYDNALSARQVAQQVKGYALDVELGNN